METDSFCDVSVPVFPPGPNSQALLKRLDNAIGRTNYVGLYGIGLKKGSGPYMMDLDDNIYLDCPGWSVCQCAWIRQRGDSHEAL